MIQGQQLANQERESESIYRPAKFRDIHGTVADLTSKENDYLLLIDFLIPVFYLKCPR